jgi:hypothetical protein
MIDPLSTNRGHALRLLQEAAGFGRSTSDPSLAAIAAGLFAIAGTIDDLAAAVRKTLEDQQTRGAG